MAKTGIEWASHSLNYYTWDCTRVSPGCKNCYMLAQATKYGKPLIGKPQWRGANTYKELRTIEPGSVVFVNSMSDTYHESVPVAWIHAIHNAAAYLRPDVTFLLLTKRPERALALAPYLAWPPNLWIGTSVESEDYLWRIEYLLEIPAAGHFISVEPLLGPLPNLGFYLNTFGIIPRYRPYYGALDYHARNPHRRIGWIICGGESGANRRPFNKAWARDIRDLCVKSKTPFMFKQGSAFAPGQDRLLDDREWNESPFHLAKHDTPKPAHEAAIVECWIDLTSHPPSKTVYRAKWGHYRECYTFYILPPGLTDCTEVPAGVAFGVVYSPSNYASPGHQDGWCYVRFKVTLQHYYAQDSKRDLTSEEQAYFEALVAARKQPDVEKIPA